MTEKSQIEIPNNCLPDAEIQDHNRFMLEVQRRLQLIELKRAEGLADQERAKAKQLKAFATQAEVVARRMKLELEALEEKLRMHTKAEKVWN